MATNQSIDYGIVQKNGRKLDKNFCPVLMEKLWEEKWDFETWHNVLQDAENGQCQFKSECDIYKRTLYRQKQKNQITLNL